MAKIPIADGHSHVSSLGIGPAQLARKFKESGGWFMALVSLPPHYYGLEDTPENLVRAVQIQAELCSRARDEGLSVTCIGGVHPATVDRIIKSASGDPMKTLDRVLQAVESIIGMVANNVIDGLGEFGRPHYKTLPASFVANELVLLRVLEASKDMSIPLHLHLEEAGTLTVHAIDKLTNILGIRELSKIVFHHSSITMSKEALKRGYSATLTGRRQIIDKMKSAGVIVPGAMLESDYIDDPKRPGIVMYPWEISENVRKAVEDGIIDEDDAYVLGVESVKKVYGVEPRE